VQRHEKDRTRLLQRTYSKDRDKEKDKGKDKEKK